MPITSTADVAAAYAAGRAHTQRFFKNAGSAGDNRWHDWAYASGQPAYDARIGEALAFRPIDATRNDAIFFPPIAAGQTRHLTELSVFCGATGTDLLSQSFELYDLLGVYPLIDGGATEAQVMTNAAGLPRYGDGVGVRAVLVNHVAPATNGSVPIVISYVDSEDVARDLTVYSTTDGLGTIAVTIRSSGGGNQGLLYLPTEGAGVKSITSVTFGGDAGGFWCVYLVKPISRIDWQGGVAAEQRTVFSVKNFATHNAFDFPQIHDGAALGFFVLRTGAIPRSVSIFGTASFVWG